MSNNRQIPSEQKTIEDGCRFDDSTHLDGGHRDLAVTRRLNISASLRRQIWISSGVSTVADSEIRENTQFKNNEARTGSWPTEHE